MNTELRAFLFSLGFSIVANFFLPSVSVGYSISRLICIMAGLYIAGLAIFSKPAEPGKGSGE